MKLTARLDTPPRLDETSAYGRASRLAWACWALTAVWLLISVGITAWDWQDRFHTPGSALTYLLKLWLYWASAAGPLVFVALLWRVVRCKAWIARAFWCFAALAVGAGSWGRLIEPELLRVRETVIHGIPSGAQPLRVALVSDIHWGLFGRDHQLKRLVQRLNSLHADAVLVAGDWTYEPQRDLAQGFAPFAELKIPVYAVLGNHDESAPGPRVADALRAALALNHVQLIEGKSMHFKGWELVGIDDLWGGKPHAQIARLLAQPSDTRLVLTHQPDTAQLFPRGAAFVTLAGHTHGGQIQLPWLTQAVLRATTRNDWWDGLYAVPAGNLFVTTGTGMIGLPMRLGVPPTIDIVELRP
jgi:uncharacterized protein